MWTQNAVSRIIRNEIYVGKIINGKEATKEIYNNRRIKQQQDQWIIVENPKLRIIDDETFHQAQSILHNRNNSFHTTRQRQSSKYLFSSLIKCRHCRRSFRRIERRFPNTCYVRWVCSSRNGNGIEACQNTVKINEEELLGEIISYLEAWLDHKAVIMEQAKKRCQALCTEADDSSSVLDLQKEMKRQQTKLKKFQDLFLNDMITMEELKEKSQPIKKQLQKAQEKLACLQTPGSPQEELKDRLDRLFHDIRQILNSENLTNEMLKRIIQTIEVDKDGNVEVILKKLGS